MVGFTVELNSLQYFGTIHILHKHISRIFWPPPFYLIENLVVKVNTNSNCGVFFAPFPYLNVNTVLKVSKNLPFCAYVIYEWHLYCHPINAEHILLIEKKFVLVGYTLWPTPPLYISWYFISSFSKNNCLFNIYQTFYLLKERSKNLKVCTYSQTWW